MNQLIVVSKVKQFIKETADMCTSAEVITELNIIVEKVLREAIEKAKYDGRKTVMNRDINQKG